MRQRGDNVLDLSRLSSDEVERAQIPVSVSELIINKCNLHHLPLWLETLTQLNSLEVAGNQLAELPETLAKLTQLQSLNISSNQLTELPEALANLTKLQRLFFCGNQLSELPKTVATLTQLQSLDLSHNHLTELPGTIAKLTQLNNLDLSHNRLVDLPETITTLTQLQALNVSQNQLTELPRTIATLTRLQRLDVWHNRLTELPETIAALTQLQDLDVAGNELADLPEAIASLTQLQGLDLSYNRLAELPESITNLTQLQMLNLSNNQLTVIPEAIATLTHLQDLNVAHNPLAELPATIAKLTQLQSLDLEYNQLTELPEAIVTLSQLGVLNLASNQLTEIPETIAELTQLRSLGLWNNQLTKLPEAIAKLAHLQSLNLSYNQLTDLPEPLTKLTQLRTLDVSNNQLTELPEILTNLTQLHYFNASNNQLAEVPETLTKLIHLQVLDLRSNRLQRISETLPRSLKRIGIAGNRLRQLPDSLGDLDNSEPELFAHIKNDDWHKQGASNETNTMDPVIRELGEISNAAIQAYLRERAAAGVTLHEAKIMLVGYGGAGKTSLKDHLLSRPFIENRTPTHALEIEPLALGEIQARIWDFGGQSEYTATQQFFYSGRAVFLVLWNPREDKPSHDDLHGWLQRIQALAPGSPILLVPTHAHVRTANVPLAELCELYPRIDPRLWPIDNQDRWGIPELQERLTEVLRQLPHMGTRLPSSWVRAMRQIEADPRNYVLATEFEALLREAQVAAPQAISLYLESIGAITRIHGQSDWVILKPQWLLQTITRVLTDKDVAAQNGAVHSDRLRAIWGAETGVVQNFLLEVLDHFDLAYQTETEPIRSIVVERCPEDRPAAVEELWATHCAQDGQAVTLRYEFDAAIPPGLPTWFIARSHRYTEPEIHWRRGGLFRDRAGRHFARLTTDLDGRAIQLTVRGPRPHDFFALLRDGFEGTTARFPGLKFERWVPCPGDGCTHRFQLEELEAYLEQTSHRCWKCKTKFAPRTLLIGLRASEYDEILQRLDGMGELREAIALIQREFTNLYRAEQSKIDHHCPAVFTLSYDRRGFGQRLKQDFPAELSLFCEFPGAWHHACTYRLQAPPELLQRASQLAGKVAPVLKLLSPTLKGKGELLEQLGENRGTALDVAKEGFGLADGHIDRITKEIGALGGEQVAPEPATGARLGALRALLEIADPNAKDRWGGLELVHTKQFHSLWVCKAHREELRRRGDSL